MSKQLKMGGGFAPPPNLIAIIMTALMIASACYAQAPDTLWTRYFNDGDTGDREECFCLIQTLDGGFLIGGQTYSIGNNNQQFMDYYLVKSDSDGIEEWTGHYRITPRHDELGGIVQMPNGDIYIAGASNNKSIANIMKANSDGDSLWSAEYGRGMFIDVASSLDGYIVAAGYTIEFEEFGGQSDSYIVKIDENGEEIWHSVQGTGSNDALLRIEATRDSGFVAVGRGTSVSQILKFTADGELEWRRHVDFPNASDLFSSVVEMPDEGFLAGGTSNWDDALLAKFNSDGDTVWIHRGIPDFREFIQDIAPAHGGGYILAGGRGNRNNEYDIMRVDDLGEEVWEIEIEFHNDAEFTEATSVLTLDDGGYLIGGNRDIFRLGGHSAGLIRLDTDPVTLPVELVAMSDSVAFGEAEDSLAWDEAAVVNMGRRYATLDSATIIGDPAPFTCPAEFPIFLSPPDTLSLPVTFQPGQDSVYVAELHIWYADEEDEPQSLSFTLTGRGLPNDINDETLLPLVFNLSEAYPNPFNSATLISFTLPNAAQLKLNLYDVNGRMVKHLVDARFEGGEHTLALDGSSLPGGVYFLRREANGCTYSLKVVLVK